PASHRCQEGLGPEHPVPGVRSRRGGDMEVHPGIFVSNIATTEWMPDPEVGGEMHVLVEEARTYVGMSRFLEIGDLDAWTLPERETILILEGVARIEIAGGPTLT